MSAALEMPVRVIGTRLALFRLSLGTMLLTLLTLGFYRFWMKTRIRRWLWSSICPGGHPLEYTGHAIEKLMGFLIAVIVLAFYIGVFNLLLTFFSFAFVADDRLAYALSFAGLVPLWFVAQYRARRYLLARTRWRGIRFGIEGGGWDYALRALIHWTLTIVTLGLLWPRMTFYLEKYRADRTWFGNARLRQGGRWVMLFPAMVNLYIGLAITGGSITGAALGEPQSLWLLLPGLVWLGVGVLSYRAHSFRILHSHKTLRPLTGPDAPEVAFTALPSTKRLFRIYLGGGTLMAVIMGAFLLLFGFAVAAMSGLNPQLAGDLATLDPQENRWLFVAMAVGSYFLFFITWGVLGQVFISYPVMRHLAESLTIEEADSLVEVSQRARDVGADAEGMADALDVGAAL